MVLGSSPATGSLLSGELLRSGMPLKGIGLRQEEAFLLHSEMKGLVQSQVRIGAGRTSHSVASLFSVTEQFSHLLRMRGEMKG